MNRRIWTTLMLGAAPLVLAAGPLRGESLVRGPFQQEPEVGRRVLEWIADATADETVRITRANGSTFDLAAGSGPEHAVDLPPTGGDLWQYEVLDLAGNILAAGTYRDLPGPGQAIRIAVIGDTGTAGPALPNLVRVILPEHPDLVIHTGDVVYGGAGPEVYDPMFFQPLEPLIANVPFYATMGNHEAAVGNAQPYLDAFDLPHNNPQGTERYYSVNVGPVHLTCLDSSSSSLAEESPQLLWAEQDLAGSTQPWIVVLFHHPPVSSCNSELYWRFVLVPLFEQYDVNLVLNGHEHWYERTYPLTFFNQDMDSGITYITQGAGYDAPMDWCTPEPYSAFAADVHSVTMLDVTAREIHVRTLDENGELIDEAVLEKPDTAPAPRVAVPDSWGRAIRLPRRPTDGRSSP